MEVLLINPPWSKRKGNIWRRIAACIPPLGLAQLASYLELQDVHVEIIDAQAEDLDLTAFAKRVRGRNPAFVGITATTNIIGQALAVAGVVRECFPAAKIVFGGVHPSVLPDEILGTSVADYVVRGEGERTFSDLIAGREPRGIAGLSLRDQGRVVHNPDCVPIENLDELPLPAYHLLPMAKYHPAEGSYRELPGIGMVTTRGCPGHCTFCNPRHLGRKLRMRSAPKIIEEIELLQTKYGIREVAFYDDTFTALQKNVVDFCNLLLKRERKVSWSCFARVDFVNEEILTLMRTAGCHQICYGVESANEQILRNIGKMASPEKAREAIRLTKAAKIETRAAFMLGSPGETLATMEESFRFACELDPDIALFNITTPYPGTEMYRWALEKGYIRTQDWGEYDLARPVMEIPGLACEDLQRFYRRAYRRFYMRPRYLMKRLSKMTSVGNLRSGMRAFRSICGVLFES